MSRRLGAVGLGPALALAIQAAGVPAPPAAADGPRVEVRPRGRPPVSVRVEIADTEERRARGLMFRTDLAPDAGMLFVFPDEAVRVFWMKDTPLPLDMIFIGADGRIRGCVERAEPFTLTPRSVPQPARYVLEVHAGFCARHGLVPGDPVRLHGLPAAAGRPPGSRASPGRGSDRAEPWTPAPPR
ncbi:MAG TPA: DUF192 domain-containing protein, partial [Thermodesulfobacteriota bacterium]|nr:DUF192 domain-containing protein [Thermodesulfobacteriota bacterium]